jgi:hypothetical protein
VSAQPEVSSCADPVPGGPVSEPAAIGSHLPIFWLDMHCHAAGRPSAPGPLEPWPVRSCLTPPRPRLLNFILLTC